MIICRMLKSQKFLIGRVQDEGLTLRLKLRYGWSDKESSERTWKLEISALRWWEERT